MRTWRRPGPTCARCGRPPRPSTPGVATRSRRPTWRPRCTGGSSHSPTTPRRRCSSAGSTSSTASTGREAPAASGSTSAGGTCTTTAATRWSSTGGPTCRRRSTGRPAPSRWTSCCGAGSASSTARSRRTRTSTCWTARGRARPVAILAGEIERPRVGPMRDIVATIQPEQDVIVRADVSRHDLRAGRAGHRQDRRRPAPGGVPALHVPGPAAPRRRAGGRAQLGVPVLHLRGAAGSRRGRRHARSRVDELVGGRVPVRATDRTPVAALKGDARMAVLLDRAVHAGLRDPTEPLVLPRGSHRWRVPTHELRDIVAELRARDVRYGAARAMLAQRLAHALLTKMEAAGESPDDRTQDAVARSVPVRKAVEALWPAVDPVRVVMSLLSDAAVLAAAAEGVLDADEQALLLWPKPARGPKTAPWSLADAVLVDEAADLVDARAEPRPRRARRGAGPLPDAAAGRRPAVLARRPRRCSATSRRAPPPWATNDWAETLAHLGKPDAHVEVLRRGYRVPGRGDRVRRPAAAAHRSGGEPAGVGARERRTAGPGGHHRPRPDRDPGGTPGAGRAGLGRRRGRRPPGRPARRRPRRRPRRARAGRGRTPA